MQKSPTCYIIAGPNGAGKTTFAMKYLPKIAGCLNFINADESARGLSPLNVEAVQLQASKIFLNAIEEKIRSRENFAFETTLSGKAYLQKIKQWKTVLFVSAECGIFSQAGGISSQAGRAQHSLRCD